MTTTKELAENIQATGETASFEHEGRKYLVYPEAPPVEDQNKWAAYHAEKERIAREDNFKEQTKQIELNFKSNARHKSIEMVYDKQLSKEGTLVPITATEKIAQAEIIYQWLVQDFQK